MTGASASEPRAPRESTWRAVFRPGQPMSWLLVPLTVAGVVALVAYRAPTLAEAPIVATAAVLAQAVVVALLLWLLRVVVPLHRPWTLLATGVAWGGGLCVFLAGYLNEQIDAIDAKLGIDAQLTLSAPIVEEALKLLGVLALIGVGRRWLRDPIDGFALGAAVGIGFLAVENVTYALSAATSAVDAGASVVESVTESLLVRSALGIGSHSLWAAIAGFGLAALLLGHARRRTARGLLVFAASVATVLVAHVLWDYEWGLSSPANILPPALVAAALVAVAAALLHRARLRLRRSPAPPPPPLRP